MQDSALITIGLPIALAIIMFGLGLSLTPSDFARVARQPKAVIGALAVQILLLPLIAFGLIKLFDTPPLLAVGVMLLVASPGGTTANLISHLFRGDVALNISLTAVNSVLAAFTIPLVTNFAINHFGVAGELGLQFAKVLQVVAIVLVPVLVGMVVRSRHADFALAADRPVRIFSIVVLAAVSVGAIVGERENVGDYFADIGLLVAAICLISLTCGYLVAVLLRLDRAQAVACSMEVGIHNTTIALAIALTVLDSNEVAVPAAVYSIVMYLIAPLFGWLVSRRAPVRAASA